MQAMHAPQGWTQSGIVDATGNPTAICTRIACMQLASSGHLHVRALLINDVHIVVTV